LNNLDELGVGLIYFQGFEDFLALHSSLIDVVEIEPQTFWYDKNDECIAFKYNPEVTDFLRTYNRPKLFHGVGYPVGGTFLPPPEHFNTLRQQAAELNPGWVSEHLSFNFFNEKGRDVNAGFLLPPVQTTESIKIAVANIQNYRGQMNRPFAFETGVNYLQPRKNEMPDGLFVNRIAQAADCHILLDLHNILTNQRNGRQSVKEFLEYLDYERVIELHVASGIYYKDYYLDAHSGASDDELMGILEYVVGKLPNLKALMFEITPDYFMKVPEAEIREQLIKMRRIWDKKGSHYKSWRVPLRGSDHVFDESIPVKEWEHTVGNLILGRNPGNPLAKELLQDKGTAIVKDLVFNFRGSLLISMLKLTTRLLRLSVGEDAFNIYINDFFNNAFPELLPVILAEQFSAYVCSNKLNIPYLEKIMEYELASIHTAIDKQNRSVVFDFDPMPVMAALEKAQLPAKQLPDKKIALQVVFEHQGLINELPEFVPVVHN
jgi:uncharacterized protein (UPF0276 family)